MTQWPRTILGRVAAALLCAAVTMSGATPPESSPSWAALTAAQKKALSPLQREWADIEITRKQKWLEVAARFPSMSADERERIQARMSEWVRMTPAERGRARLQFQETRELGAEDKQARWQAYQALPDDERRRLSVQGTTPPASAPKPARTPGSERGSPPSKATQAAAAPATASAARAQSPAVVQARPGATTTTIATRAAPPAHHQPGLPKIAATPGFVDPVTLLPKRGPQGAVAPAAASSDPAQQP